MFTPHGYPYTCSYLGWLLRKEKLKNPELLLARIEEMFQWLRNNLIKDGVEEWVWSNKHDRKYGSVWACDDSRTAFRFYHPKTCNEIRISRFIFFKHESDLLAFKLRFGIMGELSSNMLGGL